VLYLLGIDGNATEAQQHDQDSQPRIDSRCPVVFSAHAGLHDA
jgi:hypothetical protein